MFFYHKEFILNCFLKFLHVPFPQSTGNSISTFQLFHFDTVTYFFAFVCIRPFFFATHPTFFLFPIAALTFSLPLVEQNQGYYMKLSKFSLFVS